MPPALLAALLLGASVPLLRRVSVRRRVPWGLVGAHALKLGAGIAAMRTIDSRYPDLADANDYHAAGVEIAPRLKEGRWAEAAVLARTFPFDAHMPGLFNTNLVRMLTGGLYTVCGPSKADGFLVFSSAGFWGLCCFQRAFELGFPRGRHRAYARMVFCWPSILFWTSSIGKEALMTLSFGTGALGVAHVARGRRRRGLALAAAGVAGTVALRQNVASYLKRGVPAPPAQDQRGEGSAFSPPRLGSPRDLPAVAASVLFRPYPWEAGNPMALAAALEGTGLMLLTAARAPASVPEAMRIQREPYLGFVVGSLLVCVVLLSPRANFGLLVRERTPALPFYLMLLCLGRSARE